MKVLTVLNIGDVLQKGDVYREGNFPEWIETANFGEKIQNHVRQFARPMEVPDVYSTTPANVGMGSIPENLSKQSIPMEPDMSKKCENLNTSAWILLEPEEVIKKEDECLNDFGGWSKFSVLALGQPLDKECIGRRKITLPFDSAHGKPAPLTPIAFKDKFPDPNQSCLMWHKTGQNWIARRFNLMQVCNKSELTHWLPQDALPVPVESKSLSEELEDMAQSLEKSGELFSARVAAPNLLRKAAKELRK